MPKQPPNLLPNLAVSPEQLLNRPSHPTEQPEHLLNQCLKLTNQNNLTQLNLGCQQQKQIQGQGEIHCSNQNFMSIQGVSRE